MGFGQQRGEAACVRAEPSGRALARRSADTGGDAAARIDGVEDEGFRREGLAKSLASFLGGAWDEDGAPGGKAELGCAGFG